MHYNERLEWADLTASIRSHNHFSSPEALAAVIKIGSDHLSAPLCSCSALMANAPTVIPTAVEECTVSRWQYKLQMHRMWRHSAENDWPTPEQMARLAACVRNGRGESSPHCTLTAHI
jgi:hypothetical protein